MNTSTAIDNSIYTIVNNSLLSNSTSDNETKMITMLPNLETPVYFMLSTPDLNQTNHQILNKASPTQKIYPPPKAARDERRRANHNEVERRRRDNINKWIVELSKVIPDCSTDTSKHGQSKGGILEKTVQYLKILKYDNDQLKNHFESLEKIKNDNEMLKKQNEIYKKENQILKMQLESLTGTPSNILTQ